jgi:hypothetical protein
MPIQNAASQLGQPVNNGEPDPSPTGPVRDPQGDCGDDARPRPLPEVAPGSLEELPGDGISLRVNPLDDPGQQGTGDENPNVINDGDFIHTTGEEGKMEGRAGTFFGFEEEREFVDKGSLISSGKKGGTAGLDKLECIPHQGKDALTIDVGEKIKCVEIPKGYNEADRKFIQSGFENAERK